MVFIFGLPSFSELDFFTLLIFLFGWKQTHTGYIAKVWEMFRYVVKILNHCCQDFEVIVIAVIKEGNLLQTHNCTNLYYVVSDMVEHLEVKWGQAQRP